MPERAFETASDVNDIHPFAAATTIQLLRRARRGDREALDELFARHLPALRRWARGRLPRWVRTIHDTSDLIQDAALRTFQRLGSFEPTREKALQAYLRQAVHNRIIDEGRRIAVRGLPTEVDEHLEDAGPSPFDLAVSSDLEDRYRRALERLSDQDRALIVAHVEMGYSHEQLALATGRRTPDAARVALRRALVRLAEGMGDGGRGTGDGGRGKADGERGT